MELELLYPEKKNARGYIRVSTSMQKEDGVSLDTQIKRITDYCTYRNFNLIKIYKDEGISAKNMNRPDLQKMLEDIKKDEYIIIADLSRLSRNTKDALNILDIIKQKDAFLISLNPDIDFSSPSGKMMYTMLSAFSQFERESTAERVSINMINLSKQNKLRPKPPFGWSFIGKTEDMVKNKEQQVVIQKIKELYANGYSFTKISKYLNDNNFNNVLRYGEEQKFYPQTIKNILSDHNLVFQKNRKDISNKFLKSRIKK